MTFTGTIGTICMFPLRAIIAACVRLRIHPNVLTVTGVIVNAWAGWLLAAGWFLPAGVVMVAANIFDFIDGKVAHELNLVSRFGAFWDSVMDRFSDMALLIGLLYLYGSRGRTGYVLVVGFTMMLTVMTSYTRARAESLIERCKVGFMERPERIVLFMIGAFTNRMAGVLWVILALSIATVADRIYFTWRELNAIAPAEHRLYAWAARPGVHQIVAWPAFVLWQAFFWTYPRATWQYDVWVIVILAFTWLVPPAWLADPMAGGYGLAGWLVSLARG